MSNFLQRSGSVLVLTAGAAALAIPDSNLKLPFGNNYTFETGSLPSLACHAGRLSILPMTDDSTRAMVYHVRLEGSQPDSDNSLVITHGSNGYDYGLTGEQSGWELSKLRAGKQVLVAAQVTNAAGDQWQFTPRYSATGKVVEIETSCG